MENILLLLTPMTMTSLYPKNLTRLFAMALLLCGTLGLSAQFATGPVVINTQADLDNFTQTGAPGGAKFTGITGDITIDPTAVLTDFGNLSDLEDITGAIIINNYNRSQTVTDPLSTFTSLDSVGNLSIFDDDGVGETLRNSGITSVINAQIKRVRRNAEFAQLNRVSSTNIRLNGLLSLGEDLIIRNNASITGFQFNNLATIGSDLSVSGNATLVNFQGLRRVSSIGEGISVRFNNSLTSISALGDLVPNGATYFITDFIFVGNPGIETLGAISTSLRLRISDRFIIRENTGLRSITQNIQVGIDGVDTDLEIIDVSGNPALTSLAPVFGQAYALSTITYTLDNNPVLATLGGQPIQVTGEIAVTGNNSITRLPSFGALDNETTDLTGNVNISNNLVLTSTENLNTLVNVAGNISISNNRDLANLQLFNLLATANSILIDNNATIANLNDFNATPDGDNIALRIAVSFTITNNAALGNCCKPTCTTTVAGNRFDGANAAIFIDNNTGDCEDKDAVVAACSDDPGKECFATAPVDFVAFNGNLSGDHVTLDWATATETENDYFQVERSNDGLTYTAIGRVTGAGDSQDELSYTYLDYDYQPGANYYRLRQVDFDGTEDFSDVIQVTAPTASTSFAIFPNPATTSGAINFQMGKGWELERVTVDIFSASGRLVTTLNGASGLNRPIGELATGIYAVRVSDGKQTVTERLIVR